MNGVICTKFVAMKSPENASADGIYSAILSAMSELGLSEQNLKEKVVRFACDGASAMLGHKNGVAALLK